MEPEGTVTDVGEVSTALVSDTTSAVPPAGAARLNVTVQVLVAPEVRLVGLQASEEDRMTGATRVRVALLETPLMVAVTVAV